ncbi:MULTISPECIES: disulfide bond formation protein B [unclassified Pseudomonas]|uniref:disulfide bond formation protein B n=1 Tax=unclassified Pseudomonas TaxID=196821 RepID=UPI000CD13686|nr:MULTISPECIES: disulfide bond formation protein B [unclassified Pseudomonas]POA29518.1 disulfide bond formation protein B [Pseudomonas sp. GW456-R21]POA64867.1 disulfide bond formation protein B [Pseudomonas sp. GW460-R15]
MSLACTRSLFFMAFIAGALALGASYYLEFSIGLKPCGLCLLQRLFLALFTMVCLIAALHGPRRLGCLLYWLLGLFCSLAGMVTAWRQVVLQSDSVQHVSGCSPGLEGLFTDMSWLRVVERVFSGTADCAEISWTLFDLSIPEWSLLFFVGVTILGAYQIVRLVWYAYQRPPSGESSHRGRAGD